MVKRISCNVVKSVYLSKGNDSLLPAERSNERQHSTANIDTVRVRPRYADNYSTDAGVFDTGLGNLDYTIGQILDGYA